MLVTFSPVLPVLLIVAPPVVTTPPVGSALDKPGDKPGDTPGDTPGDGDEPGKGSSSGFGGERGVDPCDFIAESVADSIDTVKRPVLRSLFQQKISWRT